MKIKVLVFTFVFLTMFYSCSENKNTVSRTVENLYVENAYFDIGDVNKQNSNAYKFVFKLENKSNRLIKINNIEPSCGCVILEKVPTQILPLGNELIKGYIDTKGQNGELSKAIYVDFNEGKVMLLRIIGSVN